MRWFQRDCVLAPGNMRGIDFTNPCHYSGSFVQRGLKIFSYANNHYAGDSQAVLGHVGKDVDCRPTRVLPFASEVWVKRNGQWYIRSYSGTLIKQLVCFSHGHLMLNVPAGDFDVSEVGN